MTFEDIVGREYGPRPYRTDRSVVDAYRLAVGMEEGGPPPASLAGAMLFVVAPDLLTDPDIGDAGRSVIHGEQTFAWHRPIPLDTEMQVSGRVTKSRPRGDVAFTGFDFLVEAGGVEVVTGSSLFLMSAGAATVAGAEANEPDATSGSVASVGLAEPGLVPANRFSASRADLVRYAGASRDWNPIHWDHEAATQAGLPGVVVHGLLQSAWLLSVAEVALGLSPTDARFRYRAPLRPDVAVEVSGTVDGDSCDLRLSAGETVQVAATVTAARTGGG